jgi:hypothetical protein
VGGTGADFVGAAGVFVVDGVGVFIVCRTLAQNTKTLRNTLPDTLQTQLKTVEPFVITTCR